jgi:hypothetical protein
MKTYTRFCAPLERNSLNVYFSKDCFHQSLKKKLNSVAWSARELYRPSDCRLLAKLVPNFADIGCRMVSATYSHSR